MFISAVEAVISDDGFKFPSEMAEKALHAAGQLKNWCGNATNKDALTTFVSDLFLIFDRCIECSKRKVSHGKLVEKIWGTYHNERCSPSFKATWSSFLTSSILYREENPILYQFITDFLFKLALKKFSVEERPSDEVLPASCQSLCYEERNTIRFIAGYVLRALRKKIKLSSQTNKEEMLLCILDMTEDENDICDDSAHWLHVKDRGGLIHVSQPLYMLCSMEREVKRHTSNDFNMKGVLTEKILANEDVEFHWETISVNWGEKEKTTLLSMIVDQWITIRGFSYTSNWMEKYKEATKKKVQKSKGIRKVLLGQSSSDAKATADGE